MKKKLRKLFFSYSRINLKKIRFFLLLMFISFPLYSFDLNCVINKDHNLICSVSAEDVKGRNILRSMEIGHRAEIEYRIKIYKKDSGLFSIFGDRLVKDITCSFIGKKDMINGQFNIVSEMEGKKVYNTEKEFLEKFYILENLKINLSDAEKGNYYILGKVNLKVIKLVPPFNLFSFIIPGIVESTDWIKADTFRIK